MGSSIDGTSAIPWRDDVFTVGFPSGIPGVTLRHARVEIASASLIGSTLGQMGGTADDMDQTRRFELEEPSSADIGFIDDRLYEFNAGTTGIDDGRTLGVFLRDETKNIVAGATGHTWGETCELRQVWVAEPLRGHGYGRRLMGEAEAEAVRRGCGQLFLTTHSFQAPGFYKKLGFAVISELPNYPRGHSQFVLRKLLSR
jgi:GNAT superfamily N-acetyltransferase